MIVGFEFPSFLMLVQDYSEEQPQDWIEFGVTRSLQPSIGRLETSFADMPRATALSQLGLFDLSPRALFVFLSKSFILLLQVI